MAELPEAVAPTCPTDLLVRNTRAVHMAAWASQREDTHENGNLQLCSMEHLAGLNSCRLNLTDKCWSLPLQCTQREVRNRPRPSTLERMQNVGATFNFCQDTLL